MKKIIFHSSLILAALLFAFGCTRNAVDIGKTGNIRDTGYSDWRDVNIDSLEQLLATKTLADKELMRIHNALSLGYLQKNSEKSAFHARQGILYADKVNGSYTTKGRLYNRLGVINDEAGKEDSAMLYFNKAMEQFQFFDRNDIKV